MKTNENIIKEVLSKATDKANAIKNQYAGNEAIKVSKTIVINEVERLTKTEKHIIKLDEKLLNNVPEEDKTLFKSFLIATEKKTLKDTIKF
jgi:hypothetical protein